MKFLKELIAILFIVLILYFIFEPLSLPKKVVSVQTDFYYVQEMHDEKEKFIKTMYPETHLIDRTVKAAKVPSGYVKVWVTNVYEDGHEEQLTVILKDPVVTIKYDKE